MRQLVKVILIVATISFCVFLIDRSCNEDPVRLDPNRPGGVAQVMPPVAVKDESPITAPTARMAQATPHVAAADRTVAGVVATERPEAHGETVAAAPRSTPSPAQAKADGDINRTARATTARAARRTVARTQTARRKEHERLEAGVKNSKRQRTKPMDD
jgi:hypothetical protein